MRERGLEPPRPFGHKILSLARLPVPPLPQLPNIIPGWPENPRKERAGRVPRSSNTRCGVARRRLGTSSWLCLLERRLSVPTEGLIRKREKARIRRHVEFVRRIMKQLQAGSPKSKSRLVGDLAIDLGDLVEVGDRHKAAIKTLLTSSFPRDHEKFLHLLAMFEVDLLFEADFHLNSLKRLLPRLVRDSYSSATHAHQRQPKRTRARPGRRP